MRKEYILPLVTAWMNLEYTMLSKTRQTKTSTAQHHLYAESTEIKRVKKTTTYKRTPNRLSADFSTETLQATMEREEPTTKNTLPSKTLLQIWWRNQKLSRQAKIKRIQHHQTSFTTNAKGTSLGRKHKWRKRPTENEPETIKIQVIGSCCVLCSVTQSCPTLCDSTDCSLPSFSVHGILQASSQSFLQEIFPTQGSNPDLHIAGRVFTIWLDVIYFHWTKTIIWCCKHIM